ncbi:MAG: hypothetical protein Ta2G_10980 [Termitinemataceae bacterium]|nr:MAG: hypothetical protein Ta2G_10980 [Termitinemataceae bacterium]
MTIKKLIINFRTGSPLRLFVFAVIGLIFASETIHAQTKTGDGFLWEYAKDHTSVYITGYIGNSSKLRIPSYIEKMPVKAISGFAGNVNIVSVEIPETVIELKTQSLYLGAFTHCTALKSVSGPIGNALPKSLQRIGAYAFAGCTALEAITLGDQITYIGPQAFSDCTALTKINLPSELKKINWAAFARCTALAEIVIPEGLVEISYMTFSDCTALQKITLPVSLRHIGPQAFENCTALVEVVIQNEDIQFHDYGKGIFAGCTSLPPPNRTEIADIGYTGSFD